MRVDHDDGGRADGAEIRRAHGKLGALGRVVVARLGAEKFLAAPAAVGAVAGQLAERHGAAGGNGTCRIKVGARVRHGARGGHAEAAHGARHFHPFLRFRHGDYMPRGARDSWAVCMSDAVPIVFVDALLVVISVLIVAAVKGRWRLPCAIPERVRRDSGKL